MGGPDFSHQHLVSRSWPRETQWFGVSTATLCGEPSRRPDGIPSTEEIDPGGRALQLPVYRRLQIIDMIAPDRQAGSTFHGLHPDARALRVHFAMPVGPHATARTIAKVFRATHWAGQPGRMENTHAAHTAIKENLLAELLHGEDQACKNFGRGGILRGRFHLRPWRAPLARISGDVA